MKSLAEVVGELTDAGDASLWLAPLSRENRFADGTSLSRTQGSPEGLPPGGRNADEISRLGLGLGTLAVFHGTACIGFVDGWDVLRTYGRDVDLSSADLRGADLAKADLRGCKLTGTDFSRADLSRANLMGATASQTLFIGANLHAANLRDIQAEASSFVRASLLSVDFRGARVERCGFLHAETDGVFTENMEVVEAYDFVY